MHCKAWFCFFALLAACVFTQGAKAQTAYDVNWFTVACGGETSESVDFDLSSSIGQPAAGLMQGQGFELSSGFWTNIDPPAQCGTADFNCDGSLGTDADIEAFFACLSGHCPPPPCTSNSDFNADGDVGTDADIESFFRVLGGGHC